mmetsp:Transcript_23789/g.66876  ORF Transcript_23789/g.66876 Transcript_23789/m.66876 type:complete len:201 (+) Transcript_23789:241-843(+)
MRHGEALPAARGGPEVRAQGRAPGRAPGQAAARRRDGARLQRVDAADDNTQVELHAPALPADLRESRAFFFVCRGGPLPPARACVKVLPPPRSRSEEPGANICTQRERPGSAREDVGVFAAVRDNLPCLERVVQSDEARCGQPVPPELAERRLARLPRSGRVLRLSLRSARDHGPGRAAQWPDGRPRRVRLAPQQSETTT